MLKKFDVGRFKSLTLIQVGRWPGYFISVFHCHFAYLVNSLSSHNNSCHFIEYLAPLNQHSALRLQG